MFLHILIAKWIKSASETKDTAGVNYTDRHKLSQVRLEWSGSTEANLEQQQTSGASGSVASHAANRNSIKKNGTGTEAAQNTWGRQRRAPEQLIELGQVGDHGGLIQLLVAAHLFLWGERPDPKLSLTDV